MASLASQKSTPLLVILLAGLVGYIGYTGAGHRAAVGLSGLAARKEQVVAIQDTIARLDAATDSAKKELAKGTVEDLRKRLETYRGSLALLRRLVPERNEVPNLLDDISTRSKIRGVTLSQVVPLPVEPGPAPFDTYKYNMSVIGHYDQIGQFLADVASLQRIIVPVRSLGRGRQQQRGQGAGRHQRLAARGQVPGSHVRQVFQRGGRGQWHVTRWFALVLLALTAGAAARQADEAEAAAADQAGRRAARPHRHARRATAHPGARRRRAGRRCHGRVGSSRTPRRGAVSQLAVDHDGGAALADSVQQAPRDRSHARDVRLRGRHARSRSTRSSTWTRAAPRSADLDLVGVYHGSPHPVQQRGRCCGRRTPASVTRCGWEISWAGRG